MEMIFGNVFNQEKNVEETNCYGFSMKSFIEKEMDRKNELGITNITMGILPFEDLAIPFLYDSHDRFAGVSPIVSTIKNIKGGEERKMELIPEKLFDNLFGMVAEIKNMATNKTKTRKNRK